MESFTDTTPFTEYHREGSPEDRVADAFLGEVAARLTEEDECGWVYTVIAKHSKHSLGGRVARVIKVHDAEGYALGYLSGGGK